MASSGIASLPQPVALGDVTRWMSGGTPSRSIARYWNGTIPWISATTLKTSEISTSDQRVTAEAVVAGSKLAPLDSTLLLVRGSALHKEIRAGLVVGTVCFNQDVKALIPVSGLAPKFLTYSLLGRSHELLKLVSSAGNSAGVLDTKLVQAFEIWLPSAEEQQAIVGALSDADELVVSLERLIAKKRDIKQGAMQRLLTGKARLPGFDSEWIQIKMSSLGRTYGGLTGKTKVDFGRGDAQYITFMDVMSNVLIEGRDLPRVAVADSETQTLVQVNDLLFNGSSETPDELAMCAVVEWIPTRTYLNSFCFGFRLNSAEVANPIFLAYLFRGPVGRALLYSLAQGATRYNLSKSQFRALELYLPRVSEQQAIAQVLSDMDAEIEVLEQRLAKTNDIKQGMMQELLTGRTRLVPREALA